MGQGRVPLRYLPNRRRRQLLLRRWRLRFVVAGRGTDKTGIPGDRCTAFAAGGHVVRNVFRTSGWK